MRVEVYTRRKYSDGRVQALLRSFGFRGEIEIRGLAIVDVFLIDRVRLDAAEAADIFADPVAQGTAVDLPACESLMPEWNLLVEISYRPGVTDTVALTAREAVELVLGEGTTEKAVIQTARQYLFDAPDRSPGQIRRLAALLHNPLIQRALAIGREEWDRGKRPPSLYPHTVEASPMNVETFPIAALGDEALAELSRRRLLAFSLEEMRALQMEWRRPETIEARRGRGLPEEMTDVELEMVAQTWSEHCKHKIFNAVIDYREDGVERRIDSIFDTCIRSTTEELAGKRPDLRSVFHDNSGVVAFDKDTLLCFKAETHNSPSALDPYGGAITGIVGVNRDIIGTGRGAKPMFNTNVLCFGPPDAETVSESLLRPRQVLEGVHRGIIDGGNQSGIPVVAGAFLFDDSFIGKPLVFCGTGGILPAQIGGKATEAASPEPGDYAVMVGGRIGKDGIHGATFSSQALDETSPTSAVQIGDPITQKKMLDFLIEARDRGLYRAITDNGAGGLSSSLGEMAEECGGVRIALDRCPLKYAGLAPWEILVSESQERMSLAVPPDSWPNLSALAGSRDVEATVIGRFTDDGFVEILFRNRPVGLLSCGFLHHGLPRMTLKASWTTPDSADTPLPEGRDPKADLLDLLRDPNISSREELVRQYDHEVQARSVIKPFVGARDDGPSDGAVLRIDLRSYRGISVTHGICPRYGDYDAYRMAMCAVDEAYRAHIACGGDPDGASALDNFCWPDPVASERNPDGEYKLAQLIRAAEGLKRACLAYGLPLISGKDSMKNDVHVDGRKISVRPTLLVSLMGIVPDVRKAVTPDLKRSGDLLYVLGESRGELGGSSYERLLGLTMGPCPRVEPEESVRLYRALHRVIRRGWINTCHDLSDGGLGIAVCESALAGRLGVNLALREVPALPDLEPARLLFCESASRFIIAGPPSHRRKLSRSFRGLPFRCVGKVVEAPRVRFALEEDASIELRLEEIESAWKRRI